jgi:hippurate hydrolase
MIDRIRQQAESLYPLVRRFRHTIHAHPELSFQEHQTAAFVAEQLEAWSIPFEKDIAGTGIVALIEGRNPNSRCVAVRSELDALPIQELNDVPYRSRNEGIMHACGHDVHTACLLGVAKILWDLRADWEGTAKLIFQPGEEMHPGGGSMMIEAGVLDAPQVDAILALHVYPTLPAGVVGFRPGQYMASTDEIHITITGKGGHAALPHQTIDPIAIAAQVITGLQQLVSRKSNPVVPCVLSFGKITGGTVNNVIPDQVFLSGTLRTMDESWRHEAHELIRKFVTNTCEAFGASAEIEIPKGYPSLYNDPELTSEAQALASQYLGTDQVRLLDLRMTADDFAFYSQKIPGCYFRLGTNLNHEAFTASVHNARFDIEESSMITGVGLMAWLVTQVLRHS